MAPFQSLTLEDYLLLASLSINLHVQFPLILGFRVEDKVQFFLVVPIYHCVRTDHYQLNAAVHSMMRKVAPRPSLLALIEILRILNVEAQFSTLCAIYHK